jgi:hypothetical protein
MLRSQAGPGPKRPASEGRLSSEGLGRTIGVLEVREILGNRGQGKQLG